MSEPTGTQYAGFWARFLAFLADSAIVFLVSTALLVGAAMALGDQALILVALFVLAAAFLYWPVKHIAGLQGPVGKAIVGLKVTRFDGQSISIVRSVWREVAKVFSSAILLLGFLIAAVLPRKQALHDLLAGTYVVREGASRAFLALLIAIVGFALPVVAVPMLVDASVVKRTAALAESMVPADLMKQVPRPVQDGMKEGFASIQGVVKHAIGWVEDLIKQATSSSTPAPNVPPKPVPAPVANAPAAKSKPAAVGEWTKPASEAEAQKSAAGSEPSKPAAKSEKPKPPAPKVAAAKPVPPPPPPSTSKTGSGPMYNDLMTAVMYGDVYSVNYLLRQGRWPDKPDSRGVTPLMVAAERGDLRTAEVLLRAGASASRAVPLAQQRGDTEMVALLRRYNRR